MRSILIALILMAFSPAAQAGSKLDSLSFELGLGVPQAQIKNPDSTIAHYQGLGVTGRARIPLFEEVQFGAQFTGALRYLDLQNTANTGTQKEVAEKIGPGLGLELRLGRILLGAEYYFLKARHYSIGPISESLEYDSSELHYYVGFGKTFGALSVALSYQMGSGNVPASKTGLTSNAPYSDQTIWLQFKYFTGMGLG